MLADTFGHFARSITGKNEYNPTREQTSSYFPADVCQTGYQNFRNQWRHASSK